VDQKWFEMPEIRKRQLESAVWIPLRSAARRTKGGEYGALGHISEFYGVGTLAVPVGDKATASKLDWQTFGLTLA
jgi:hypothetical protein